MLFPLVVYLLVKLNLSKRNAFICATLPFLTIPPYLRELAFLDVDPELVRQITLPRLDAMFYGVGMSFFIEKYGMKLQYRGVLFVTSMIILLSLLIFDLSHVTKGHVMFYRVALILLPITFSMAMPFMSVIKQLPTRFSVIKQFITSLSLWSYSIYLSHIPIMFTVYALFGHSRDNVIINIFSKLVALVLCLILSRALFIHFESKLTKLRPANI